eukprot:TRINITY_DN1712_c2_g3_i1.p1 TRINITY_DN1712_c2_g3~~TRINITY_DN1712_c2_g3_i1.p1  ORF type:complete len:741 (+),score=202.55 TRINITY_DN1712_c2_g3_i1:128-2350(+)
MALAAASLVCCAAAASSRGCNGNFTRGVLRPGRVCGGGLMPCGTLEDCESAAASVSRSLSLYTDVRVQLDPAALKGCYLDTHGQAWWNPLGDEGADQPAGAAAICLEGMAVMTWGDSDSGGDSGSVRPLLSSLVTRVYGNHRAFAAKKLTGGVVTWGEPRWGGDSSTVQSQLRNVKEVFSSEYAFAALTEAGAVVPWGAECPNDGGNGCGGDGSTVASLLQDGVVSVYSTSMAFAALKAGGAVVAWGDGDAGGNSSTVAALLTSGVVDIVSTSNAFSALKRDGGVVTWGRLTADSDQAQVRSPPAAGVKRMFSTSNAFAGITTGGGVVAWGPPTGGGDTSTCANQLRSGTVDIVSTKNAFAALKEDGSVVTWGHWNYGGDAATVSALLSYGVRRIRANQWSFAALKPGWRGGGHSVVTWGGWGKGSDGVGCCGSDTTTVAGLVSSGVEDVYSTDAAFAALRTNGRVVTWGNIDPAGAGAKQLNTGVVSVCSTSAAFAAVRSDGTLVTWGDPSVADYSRKVVGTCSGVSALSATRYAFAAGVPSLEQSKCIPASPAEEGTSALPDGAGIAIAAVAVVAGIAVFAAAPAIRRRRRSALGDYTGETLPIAPQPAEQSPQSQPSTPALTRQATAATARTGDSLCGGGSTYSQLAPILVRDVGGEVVRADVVGDDEDTLKTLWSTSRARQGLHPNSQMARVLSGGSLAGPGSRLISPSATDEVALPRCFGGGRHYGGGPVVADSG